MAPSQRSFYTYFYVPAFVFLLAYIIVTVNQQHTWGGWALMLFFVSLAFAFRSNKFLKGFSYTVTILAAVSLAMYHPEYFRTIGDFNLSLLIVPLLQIIMFGMGTELSVKDFGNVLKMPKGIIVGVLCQFTIMPFVGFTIAHLFNFPSEIAAGIILISCCPSGLASNVMSYLARANLALSIAITTIATMLAPLLTPFLMNFLGGEFIQVQFWSMVWDITIIVIIPVLGGLLFNHYLHGKFSWLDKAMPIVSMAGIALIITVITAAGRDSLLKVGGLLILAMLIHNLTGFFLGYWASRILGFSEKDSRTISLEVGMQNGGLASGLALTMGKLATVGLAPAVFGPLMNITGSSLASWWHNRLPDDDAKPHSKQDKKDFTPNPTVKVSETKN